MATQKNIGVTRAGPPLVAATLALLMIFLLMQSSWVWKSLYFQYHTATEISLAIGLLTGFVMVCVALFCRGFGQAMTIKLINVGIAILLINVGFQYLKLVGMAPTQSNALHKSFAAAAAIAAALLTFKISVDTWKRLHRAAIVGGLIFIIFPVVLANMNASTVYWPSPSYQLPTAVAPTVPAQNTIVLLFDEFSASAAEPVVRQLQTDGLKATLTGIDPIGKNTISVIPAIWMRTSFDQSSACGRTQLCSGTKVLDFAKVKASSENIDIVGFYHRYCSIQGLRSCTFSPFPKNSVFTELVCSLPLFSMLGSLGCNGAESDRESFLALREHMQRALMEAPFWQKGGILYAHLLEPHPLMGSSLKTLSEEYADNIAHGAEVIKLVVEKAKLVYGDNFKIIVFSDHPLRPELWCANNVYASLKCKPDPSQISTQVPLIIAAPYAGRQDQLSIKNNQAIFDLLFL